MVLYLVNYYYTIHTGGMVAMVNKLLEKLNTTDTIKRFVKEKQFDHFLEAGGLAEEKIQYNGECLIVYVCKL